MYERFTDRARKVVQLAQQEAQRFNYEYVAPEHLLIGMVKEGAGVAANVLRNMDVDLRKLREACERSLGAAKEPSTAIILGRVPFTPHARMLVEMAVEAARTLGHNYVGTEHLLLGACKLAEHFGAACQLHWTFTSLNISLKTVQEEVMNLLGHGYSKTADEESREESRDDVQIDAEVSWIADVAEGAPAEPAKRGIGVGSVVQLRSGGPPMTVTSAHRSGPGVVEYDVIWCSWFNRGELHHGQFVPAVLDLLDVRPEEETG